MSIGCSRIARRLKRDKVVKIAREREKFIFDAFVEKFQRRISIKVRLTEGSLCNRFRIERSPKIGFRSDLGIGAKIYGEKVHSSSELRVFIGIFGPDLTPRVVALCMMGITICHRLKFGQVWGSPAPLPDVAENLRSWKAPTWNFKYHTEKTRNHSAM